MYVSLEVGFSKKLFTKNFIFYPIFVTVCVCILYRLYLSKPGRSWRHEWQAEGELSDSGSRPNVFKCFF